MSNRRSVASLSPTEIGEFQDAIWALKRERVTADGLSTYDRYVVLHNNSMGQPSPWPQDVSIPTSVFLRQRNAAHRGPSFLPWHREFLRRFELDLQRVSGNPNLGLPYWDWAADTANPDASKLWDIVGPSATSANQGITTGRFGFDPTDPTSPDNWVIVDRTGLPDGGIIRSCGHQDNPQAPRLTLPVQTEIDFAKSFADYDVEPWNELSGLLPGNVGFRNLLERWVVEAGGQSRPVQFGNGLHNRVHVWVGSTMGPGTSPNDPIFFLHHAFVDKTWADWQQQHAGSTFQPQVDGPIGHTWPDLMYPWNNVTTFDTATVAQGNELGSVRYV